MALNNQISPPCVLTVAGSDSCAGAGIQADLKTLSALGVYGTTAITAVTAQNSVGVRAVVPLEPNMVRQQMLAVLEDFPVAAVKLGMLHNGGIVEVVCEVLERYPQLPVVLDPVLVSSSGRPLLDDPGLELLLSRLLKRVTLVTPNIPEAARLLGCPAALVLADRAAALARIQALGVPAVLLKGGHLETGSCEDLLWHDQRIDAFEEPRHPTRNTHGTGCTLASAIAGGIAQGWPLLESVSRAKAYVTGAIRHADQLGYGAGAGPLHHFFVDPQE